MKQAVGENALRLIHLHDLTFPIQKIRPIQHLVAHGVFTGPARNG
jgi:hypothetical protein